MTHLSVQHAINVMLCACATVLLCCGLALERGGTPEWDRAAVGVPVFPRLPACTLERSAVNNALIFSSGLQVNN